MQNHPSDSQCFSSVWDALEDTPLNAANMRLGAKLMRMHCETIHEWALSREDTAERLGITQTRLNDLFNGEIDKFSLDELTKLAIPAA